MYKIYAQLRDERGLTDYRVAKDLGLQTATFSEWKKGTYQPKVDKIAAIARYFDVPLETFYPIKSEV